MLLDAAVSEGSSANTKALDAWVTERLKERANIQKQTRLFREEASLAAKGKGYFGGGWRNRRRMAKEETKAKEKAGASRAAETEGRSRCERGSR